MIALAATVVGAWLMPVAVCAQVRFRRPLDPAPAISSGYDDNPGGGCQDYACGGRCYDGHSGTDFPVGLGTPVLAGAAGTVVATNNGCANFGGLGNTCGGSCGNYVQLQHDDGTRTIYCHMQLDSIAVGRGQTVGCGQVLGRSASSGSSTGPHLHFGWQRGGVSLDPFSGRCSNGGDRWVDQRDYPNSPGEACEGPPPPPPCIAREGPFGWNCSGPLDGMTCTNIAEPSDPDTWGDNFLCSDFDRGLRWSSAGPLAGMNCLAVNESAEPVEHTWSDNFLCAPSWLPYTFRFGTAGPIAGMNCLPWAEPADPHTWNDNFLCWTRDADCARREGPFAWSCAGPVAGMTCTVLAEPSDPDTWGDNVLCAERDLGLRWSSAGPIAGMTCTAITEGSEPAEHTWSDNFLCAPPDSEYAFGWSSAGPITRMTCLAWYEPSDPHTWEDNFLCWRHTPALPDAGPPPVDAPSPLDAAPDALAPDALAPVDATDAATRDLGAPDVAADSDAAAPDDLSASGDLAPEDPPRLVEGGFGCGCRVTSLPPDRSLSGLLLLAIVVRVPRRAARKTTRSHSNKR